MIRQETMMTASATAPTKENAARARENSEYVRSLLNVRQPSSPLRSNRRPQAPARPLNSLRVVTKE
jgi:hypothetical protein